MSNNKLFVDLSFESPKTPILGDIKDIVKTVSCVLPNRVVKSITQRVVERIHNKSVEKMFDYHLSIELDENLSIKDLDSTVFSIQDVIDVPKDAWDNVRVSCERG